jgi:hypothetical protein
LRKDKLGTLSVHTSYGVLSTYLVGTLFRVKIVVSRAYPQKNKSSYARLIIDLTIYNSVRFIRSYTPFHCGVLGGVSYGMIPHCFRWSLNSILRYSPQWYDRIALIFFLIWFSTSFWNSLNLSKDSDLCIIRNTSSYLLKSSVNIIKYEYPPHALVPIGPYMSVYTRAKSYVPFHSLY